MTLKALQSKPNRRSAFSTSDTVWVLLLLMVGFWLVGGMLSTQCGGWNAAGLRSITAQYDRHTKAIASFHAKYNALPGDMKNATELFGKDAINGNGDGMIDTQTAEPFQFWRQLALAKLIEGNYSGTSASASTTQWEFDKNAPASHFFPIKHFWDRLFKRKTGWSIMSLGAEYVGDEMTYAGKYGLVLVFGGLSEDGQPGAPVLTPEEAWNIDTKLDDGSPATGVVRARNWRECTTSASNTDMDGNYKLIDQSRSCALYFLTGH